MFPEAKRTPTPTRYAATTSALIETNKPGAQPTVSIKSIFQFVQVGSEIGSRLFVIDVFAPEAQTPVTSCSRRLVGPEVVGHDVTGA